MIHMCWAIVGCPERESIVICISPLNSLMMDQQRSFGTRGIKMEFIEEAQNDKEGSVSLVLITELPTHCFMACY